MANRIQLRRGTAAQWAAANPVLAQGEPGIETNTGKQKFGDGVTAWNLLSYASKGDTGAQGPAGVADDASVKALVQNPASETATALNATYGPDAIANPETLQNAAVQGLIDSSLAGFTPADVPKQHYVGSDLNAARPAYPGPIIWIVTVEGFPVNRTASDSTWWVSTVPAPIPDVTIFADDFNRADGAIHGTTTPTGGLSWTVTNGTSAVVSNQLGVTAVTTDSVNSVVNAGQSDGVYTATLAAPGTDSAMTLLFRYVDTNNYLSMTRISSANKSWRITKRVAGTVTMIHETSHLIAAGDVLEVTLAGTTVTVKIAGVQVYTGTITEHSTATRYGFRGQADGHRWDNVSFVVPGE